MRLDPIAPGPSSLGARGWLALWTVYLVWGSTYLGIALAIETIPALLGAGLRFLAAGVVMLAFVALRHGASTFRLSRTTLLATAAIGLMLTGSNALVFVAEERVPSGLAALVVSSVPLWVVLIRLTGRERPTRAALAGIALGFAGVALLVLPGAGNGAVSPLGVAILLVASANWALASYLSPRLPLPADAMTSTGIGMLAGGLVLLPLGAALAPSGSLDPGGYSARSLAGLVYLIVAGSVIALTAYVWLLAHAPLGTVSTYAYVNPIVAIALGALVLDERITVPIVAGALLVVAGVAAVVRTESRAAPTGRTDSPAGRRSRR